MAQEEFDPQTIMQVDKYLLSDLKFKDLKKKKIYF